MILAPSNSLWLPWQNRPQPQSRFGSWWRRPWRAANEFLVNMGYNTGTGNMAYDPATGNIATCAAPATPCACCPGGIAIGNAVIATIDSLLIRYCCPLTDPGHSQTGDLNGSYNIAGDCGYDLAGSPLPTVELTTWSSQDCTGSIFAGPGSANTIFSLSCQTNLKTTIGGTPGNYWVCYLLQSPTAVSNGRWWFFGIVPIASWNCVSPLVFTQFTGACTTLELFRGVSLVYQGPMDGDGGTITITPA